MKFVHFADIHFDMVFTSLKANKELIKQRRDNQKKVFKNAIDLAKEKNVDAIFIAGDLFENKYVEDETIKYIISCFKSIPDIKIFITPGNHDPLIKNSPYNTYTWPENVYIFGSEVGMYEVNGVNVYGIGFEDYEMQSDAVKDIEVDKSIVSILITHGNLNGATHQYHDIKSKDLEKFNYVALGHIHLPKIDDSNIIYPGSLVAGGFDELGEHGLVLGEITKEKCNIEFIKMDPKQFVIKTIDISDLQTIFEIADKLDLGDDIYKVVLTGTRNIDISKLTEVLDENVCEIVDNTHLPYDLEEISKQKTLKGIFTKNMLEKIKENPDKESSILKGIEFVYKNM